MNELKALEDLLEIIWGTEPKKKRKPRNSKGRFVKKSSNKNKKES